LTRTHRILVGIVVAGAVVIAGIGFAGSYAAVRTLALHKGFGWFANVFPIGVDAGIVVLLALDLLLTWLRIPFPLLRQTAWLLTAATIAFNGAAAWPDPLGVGMHAIIPVLFVVAVEAARHAIGRVADITADKHMESVRITRWVLAPVPTFRLWRRMKLWELRSYEETIRREQDRLVYRARLRARYGVAWRRRAPIEAIMPLRLARYGVPLAETAEAGLAAAGIDVAPVVKELAAAQPSGAAAGTEQAEPQGQSGRTGQSAAVPAPGAQQGPTAEQAPPVAAGMRQPSPVQQEFQEFYDPQQGAEPGYEQYADDGSVPRQPVMPHDSPWFAPPYPQQYQQQYPQQYPQQPVMAPVGPYQERPLGYGALNGGAPTGMNGGNGVTGAVPANGAGGPVNGPVNGQVNGQGAGFDGVNGADAGHGGPAGANGHAFPGPGQEQPQQQPSAQPEPGPEPEPEVELETFPLAGLDLPEDVSPADAYFAAYRAYAQQNGTLPGARQLARFLPELYSGTPPEERHLVKAVRELRYRYTSEANAETIP
jgi:hypothetical protein